MAFIGMASLGLACLSIGRLDDGFLVVQRILAVKTLSAEKCRSSVLYSNDGPEFIVILLAPSGPRRVCR